MTARSILKHGITFYMGEFRTKTKCLPGIDDIKLDDAYRRMFDWHWVTIPSGKTYEETEKIPRRLYYNY